MDGSGKSTQCQRLSSLFHELGAPVKCFHMGAQSTTIGTTSQDLPFVNKIHCRLRDLPGKGISRVIKITVGLAYYLVDSWISHFLHEIKYRHHVVIYDRYFFDFLAIFVSNFYQMPLWILRFSKIFPRSHILIFMETESPIAKKRRPEHPIEQLERYRNLYRRLGDLLKAHMIDGAKNLRMVEKEVDTHCKSVLEKYNNPSGRNFRQ